MKPTNFIAIVLVVAVASHALALHLMPYAIMSIAMQKLPTQGVRLAEAASKTGVDSNGISAQIISQQGINVAMPSARMDHNQRNIVRSTPDILYTACVYDLNEGALQLTTPTFGGYTSVSAFAHNTDNYFTQDDRSAVNSKLDITLVPKHWQGNVPQGSTAVVSPTDKGIVLFRVLIENETDFDMHVQRQLQARCTTVKYERSA
jgi:uncharacterized membrane protein